MSAWKTLDLENLGDKDIENQEELDLQEDLEDDQVEEEVEVQEEPEDEEEQSDSDEQAAQEPKEKTARKSRAQERIKQLVQERKDLEAKLRAEQEARKSLEQNSMHSQKETFKTQLNMLETNIESTKRELKRALEEQDIDSVLELQQKLGDYSVDKRVLEAKASKIPAEEESKKQTEPAQQMQLPEEMRYWLEDNKWAIEPQTAEERKKVRFLRKTSRALLAEGFVESEPDFFDELDERLEKEFGSSQSDVLDYEQEDDNSSDAQTEKRARKKPVQTSPVGGAGRSAPASSSKKVPKPTDADRETARRLNLDINAYMRRKAEYQATRKEQDSGWVNVF